MTAVRIGRGGYLGIGRRRVKRGTALDLSNKAAFANNDSDRTEADKARRATRDWLRDRERQDGDELLDWSVGNGWE